MSRLERRRRVSSLPQELQGYKISYPGLGLVGVATLAVGRSRDNKNARNNPLKQEAALLNS